MKNNTLAIALGSLLVGGVATAGFINNRDAARSADAPRDVAAAQYTDAYGEPLPVDGAVPASGRLEYVDVLAVGECRASGSPCSAGSPCPAS